MVVLIEKLEFFNKQLQAFIISLKVGNEYIKSIGHTTKFCYADVNC